MRVHVTHFSSVDPPALQSLTASEELPWEGLDVDPPMPRLRGPQVLTAVQIVSSMRSSVSKRQRNDMGTNAFCLELEVELDGDIRCVPLVLNDC